jgi:hypothetical protein
MAQVLSTFSRLEQSRFEAFRRSTLPGDAIRKYIAHCLVQQRKEHTPASRPAPALSHLCAPGQAEEITIVVSTLAKSYAQRLITAARRAAPDDTPIQPQHILNALEERKAQGLDPGFFLQASHSASSGLSSILKRDSNYETKRLAALQAQEDYDKLLQQESNEKKSDDSMDISPAKASASDPSTPQSEQLQL